MTATGAVRSGRPERRVGGVGHQGSPTRRKVRAVAAAAAAVMVVSGCALTAAHPASAPSPTGPAVGNPVRVSAAPLSPPRTGLQAATGPPSAPAVQVCRLLEVDDGSNAPDRGVMGVDPHPVGAVAEWLPGLTQRPCRAQLTRVGQPMARRLAAAVIVGQPIKVGAAYSCPFDDLTAVELFFQYPGRVVETVSVDLSGCGWINAPARTSRFVPATLRTELDTIAPAPWQS